MSEPQRPQTIIRAADAIGELHPEILAVMSVRELRLHVERFAAQTLAIARQRRSEDIP